MFLALTKVAYLNTLLLKTWNFTLSNIVASMSKFFTAAEMLFLW
jgi:hypothetical protein